MELLGIDSLQNNIELNKELNNNIYENQKNFLQSDLAKTINSALDIGLKAALPNLIEDQIIDIKNIILEQGFKDGLTEIINTGIDFGKSAIGIVTGEFDNISQVRSAIKKGGIIDSISQLLDYSIKIANNSKLINNEVAGIIKAGKNTILEAVGDKIESNLDNQLISLEKIQDYCEKWNNAFNEKDISKMNKIYNNIKNYESKIMPIENTIMEIKKIDNIQELLKNNGNNFNISENEFQLASKL